MHDLYARQHKVVLGKIATPKKHHGSNMHIFVSMFGCYDINVGKKLKLVCNRTQARKYIQERLIFLSGSDHDYLIE